MTLTTHALVGAAAASLFPNHPVAAFVAGFASHLAIDSIPHWDYTILSMEQKRDAPLQNDMNFGKLFAIDLLRIGFDCLLGLVFSVVIFSFFLGLVSPEVALIGAVAGILPDPLQFAYMKTRSRILLPLQRFHLWLQKGKQLSISPLKGISFQLAIVVAASLIVILIR
ncbi:MAG TPA: hypothetical protein VHF05_02125 [Candidatus Paceibacterota bacterium]|jgi:hypothetical protein|nr:hypothetical protein [Candidatus Paceibacterota bacterium]